MSEPRPYSYDEFPESEDSTRGMRTLPKDDSARTVRYIRDVPYALKDGTQLHLQILVPNISRTQVFGAPDDPNETYPLIVYVVGSAWMKQDMAANLPQLARFASASRLCESPIHPDRRPAHCFQSMAKKVLEPVGHDPDAASESVPPHRRAARSAGYTWAADRPQTARSPARPASR